MKVGRIGATVVAVAILTGVLLTARALLAAASVDLAGVEAVLSGPVGTVLTVAMLVCLATILYLGIVKGYFPQTGVKER